jgi:cytochrome P450
MSQHLQGPLGDPLEELQKFSADPFSYLEECQRHYGNIFLLPFSGAGSFVRNVVLADPAAIQIFYSAETLKYLDNEPTPSLNQLLGGTHHLTSANKTTHGRLKKLMMPHLHRSAIEAQAQHIWDIAVQVSAPWQDGQSFAVLPVMERLTLEVIVQVVFGVTAGAEYEELKDWITKWLTWSASPEILQALYLEDLRRDEGPESTWGRHLHNLRQLDQLLYALIEGRRAQPLDQPQDMLSMFMVAEDEEGNKLTDEEIRDNLVLDLFAGNDATASALTWSLYALHNHPNILAKLQQALDSLGRDPDLLSICKQPYLDAVYKEVLRLYFGFYLSISRVLNSPLELLGYCLEPGMTLCTSSHLLHQRADLYPEPQQFCPERFLGREFGSHEWAPFGGASALSRLCPS